MKISEITSSELFDQITDIQKDDIYRMVWHSHVKEDVKSVMEDAAKELPESEEDRNDLADKVATAYVYDGRYDCNLSYWTNLANLIREIIN